MDDTSHETMNFTQVFEEAASITMRRKNSSLQSKLVAGEKRKMMMSFLGLLESIQIAERNNTSEREALSAEDKEDAMKSLGYSGFVLIFVSLVTFPSIVDAFVSNNLAEHLLAVAFLCLISMSFMASLILIHLELTPMIVACHGQGICSRILGLCTGVVRIGLLAYLTIWSSRSFTTSICFSVLVVATLLCKGHHLAVAFLRKPLENWNRNSQETLQKCSKHWDTGESEDHRHPALLSDPQGTVDAAQRLQMSRMYLLLLWILAATMTYLAGLEPAGGLWQENATDGLHYYRAGDRIILHTTYARRYLVLIYCNTTALVTSLVVLILLDSNVCRTQGIKSYALQVAMTLDLLGLIGGAYAAGSCRISESADPAADDEDDPKKPREVTWRVACAAVHHMTGDQSLLLPGGYMPVHDGDEGVLIHLANNGEAVALRVHGLGSVRTESIVLDDVWYVPGLEANLVSTGQLARQGCAVSLGPGGCRISRGGDLVGTARFTEASQFELEFLKVADASSM